MRYPVLTMQNILFFLLLKSELCVAFIWHEIVNHPPPFVIAWVVHVRQTSRASDQIYKTVPHLRI